MSKKGIDVSSHQGNIDWKKVKESGIEFAMLRMGVGSDIESQTDTKVFENARECEKYGIPYGIYIYSYALNEADVHSETQHMIRVAKRVNATLGCWYDMEDADNYKQRHNFPPRKHGEELTGFCKIFLKEMRNAGYENVGVYASYDYFKSVLNLEELRKNGKIWLAHWGVSKPSIDCEIWQYSSTGKVDGVSGNVDMNIWYGDFSNSEYSNSAPQEESKKSVETLAQEVIEGKWGNGEERKRRLTANGYDYNTIQAKVNDMIKYSGTIYHIVVKGDTLSEIAKRYKTSVDYLVKTNKISNKNMIYRGQKIRIK